MDIVCQKHDLANVVTTCIQEIKPLADKKSIKITVEKADHNTSAAFDFDKILQVVRNLLSNSIKFTPDGGDITISFLSTSLPASLVEGNRQEVPATSVIVTDTGVGIPKNELETMFDKFVQSTKIRTGGGGTGLGLAICKEILAMHKGTISVTSQEDKGSQFIFSIPCEELKIS